MKVKSRNEITQKEKEIIKIEDLEKIIQKQRKIKKGDKEEITREQKEDQELEQHEKRKR